MHALYVERFFNYIKQFRGIATRYEKTARNFLAGLHLDKRLAREEARDQHINPARFQVAMTSSKAYCRWSSD